MPFEVFQNTDGPALFMAPMEGITDLPFRNIVKKHGCGVLCTQMIHAEALLRGSESPRVIETSTMVEQEGLVGLQLCGPVPSTIAEAAVRAEELGAQFIDINMGCPAKNVVKIGAGAALLLDPPRAAEVVLAVRRRTLLPVTVKIRAGWDDTYRNAIDMAKHLEDAGASLVTVHARTRAQKFKGKADWNLIAELKRNIRIPVIGNGDITQPEDIDEMIRQTNADGVMIGRGALGNPWIFSRRRPTVGEIKKVLLEHLDGHLSFYSNISRGLLMFRKHLVWYTHGLAHATEFRAELFRENSQPTLLSGIHRFFERFDPDGFPA